MPCHAAIRCQIFAAAAAAFAFAISIFHAATYVHHNAALAAATPLLVAPRRLRAPDSMPPGRCHTGTLRRRYAYYYACFRHGALPRCHYAFIADIFALLILPLYEPRRRYASCLFRFSPLIFATMATLP